MSAAYADSATFLSACAEAQETDKTGVNGKRMQRGITITPHPDGSSNAIISRDEADLPTQSEYFPRFFPFIYYFFP